MTKYEAVYDYDDRRDRPLFTLHDGIYVRLASDDDFGECRTVGVRIAMSPPIDLSPRPARHQWRAMQEGLARTHRHHLHLTLSASALRQRDGRRQARRNMRWLDAHRSRGKMPALLDRIAAFGATTPPVRAVDWAHGGVTVMM